MASEGEHLVCDNVSVASDQAKFAGVLSEIDLDHLPQLAARVRRQLEDIDGEPVVGNPIYGSYNVVFPLDFSDGVRWLAKIPATGTTEHWSTPASNALTSEAMTMRLLKQKTTIPLPEVFDFSATTQNELRCPYILMSFIRGVSLYDVWFDKSSSVSESTRTHRTQALKGIADAMAQLGAFSFATGGAIVFNPDQTPGEVGSAREPDIAEMLRRAFQEDSEDDAPVFAEVGPFQDTKAYYTCMLDRQPPPLDSFFDGISRLLREFISWIPEPESEHAFVLTHPDFDIQNFIVSEEGELRGIIDWDGVAALPRSLGNERYPGWLTRDWDPDMYGYNKSMADGEEPEGVWEDSPHQLSAFRAIYDDFMQERRLDKGDAAGLNLTRLSLLTDNLAIAARDPSCRNGILTKILEEISKVLELEEPLDFIDFAGDLGDNLVDDATLDRLKAGLSKLAYAEGL